MNQRWYFVFGISVLLMSKLLRNQVMAASTWANKIHAKCRQKFYPRTNDEVQRFPVPDGKVKWSESWPEYNPTPFTSSRVLGQPWADPDTGDSSFHPKWNSVDGTLNRESYQGKYSVLEGRPLNPVGRTGIVGRGVLGRWGPNHAADCILTRWMKDSFRQVLVHEDTKKPILEFLAIERRNGGEWALPGGMVDPGEEPLQTAQREFFEEALNGDNLDESQADNYRQILADLFKKHASEIYRGYVDDPRNTDNSWMETVAINCHLEGNEEPSLKFAAGSDAKQVSWLQIDKNLNLYASHLDLIELVAQKHGAHF